MNTNLRVLPLAFATLLAALLFAACGSSKRTTIDGYDDAMLNGRRIFVLTPLPEKVAMNNPDQFGAARGVAGASAREMLGNEFRTMLIPAMNQQLDSNTTLSYAGEPIGSMVALNATSDFNNAGPLDWEKIARAAREANIDFMVVLRVMNINNTGEKDGGRGDEAASGEFLLLDAQSKKVMTRGEFDVEVKAPRSIETTWQNVAIELSKQMPFWVGE